VAVVRGRYTKGTEIGEISPFQALSAALSATVGLGNIAGVAVAVALGGPGAILWMWVIGVVGMALKMTEVTQSMMYRNTDDPENPHGGPMFVLRNGLARSFEKGRTLSVVSGVTFALVITWCGLQWGGVLVPAACAFVGFLLIVRSFNNGRLLGSLLGGIFVVTLIISAVTGGNMFQAWNVADVTRTYTGIPQVVPGVIMTLLVGAVILGGIKRIGAVTGRLVPFMCGLYLLTGLVVIFMDLDKVPAALALIFKSGLPELLGGESASPEGAFLGGTFGYAAMWGVKRALFSSEAGQGSAPIAHSAAKTDEPVREGIVAGLEPFVDTLVVCTVTALVILLSGAYNRPAESEFAAAGAVSVVPVDRDGDGRQDEALGVPQWTLVTPPLPERNADAKAIHGTIEGAGWTAGEVVFLRVHADQDADTGRDIRRMLGTVAGSDTDGWRVEWGAHASARPPALAERADGAPDQGVYADYAGASLTAHAFDRALPGFGLGKWLVTLAAWLFAVSTMISWSYYGEQGVVYLFARLGDRVTGGAVVAYRLIYCLLILVTCLAAMPIFRDGRPLIGTDRQLDDWTTLGLGVMLVANIPIMLLFGPQAMREYHRYVRRLRRGELHRGAAQPLVDVIAGAPPGDEREDGPEDGPAHGPEDAR
jgi:AGCS family alanine or glycine:cation symporter